MAVMLAPYNNAMRLGQGFNSYTQQICVDDAVVIDPNRSEVIVTNDGTTMRIVAETAGKPSAWNRIRENVNEGPVNPALCPPHPALEDGDGGEEAEEEEPQPAEEEHHQQALTKGSISEASTSGPPVHTPPSSKEGGDTSETESAVHVDAYEVRFHEAMESVPAPGAFPDAVAPPAPAASAPKTAKVVEDKTVTKTQKVGSGAGKDATSSAAKTGEKDTVKSATTTVKQTTSKSQVKQAPKGGRKGATSTKAELSRIEREDKIQRLREEKARLVEQRAYQAKLDAETRADERIRQAEDRAEQRQIRNEKRAYDAARRQAAQKAMAEAAAKYKDALTLAELDKVRAQNQFADRFDGIDSTTELYTFDPASGGRGPSQTVTYSSRFVDRLSDVTEDMAISGALSVKMAKIGGSGRGSFVDSDKFKESDLNFYISVKVANQSVNFKDALVYNPMRSVEIGSDDFNKTYGDSFISGFQEGGEFNAIISMKVHNKAKLLDIKAEAKVALTAGPVDITAEANVGIARTNLEMNTETTIQVSWCGGGHIKPMEQPWNMQSVMQAAARFPSLVSACPQRTHAILTKYDSLRSFVSLRPASFSPLQYENAQIYTSVLMDAFMSYKSKYKSLGDQVFRLQNKTLEFDTSVPAPTDGQLPLESSRDPNSKNDNKDQDKKDEKDKDQAVAAKPADPKVAKQRAAALAAAVDTSRFEASLRGMADARKFIRRQMIYIVNEVDLIEKDPKLATDEDHEEPFQSPLLFETRLPATKTPEALKRSSDPLTGRRIMAKTQTEAEIKKEQDEKAALESDSPPLWSADQDLLLEEQTSLDAVRTKVPGIGKHLQVSMALPKTEAGQMFNNLEFLYPDWQATTITIGISARGSVGSVEVVYENGLVLKKGIPDDQIKAKKSLGSFIGDERITSAAIETGTPVGKQAIQVLSVCMYTNRGRRLLGQAAKNEVLASNRVRKDGVEYENVHTLFCDSAYSKGTFKGFFGRLLLDNSDSGGAGVRRLGIIWGDSVSSKLSTTIADAAPVYDTDAATADANTNAMRSERDAARTDAQQQISAAKNEAQQQINAAKNEAQKQINAAKQQSDREKAEAVENAKQIRFGCNVYSSRQSVSFKAFKCPPTNDPFLRFENGNRINYQRDGNLVVYDKAGRPVWSISKNAAEGQVGDMIFHGDNDGNLVAWNNKYNGGIWSTETKQAKGGTLVWSSEPPFLEIFNDRGQRQCNYP
ncbi:hypothetical protein BD289DRAFT_454493 [Coniella lustricola]|uniref:Bulb-type lectin domain-containing protein n=1 Tax=Coniella lustricola TaxID=2025994 RepID=A0A2T3A385_9PEZI|nr:hypothetical protein BD289DRAFT_454493 [Coniella lustricola]